jgi:hypothetical protein
VVRELWFRLTLAQAIEEYLLSNCKALSSNPVSKKKKKKKGGRKGERKENLITFDSMSFSFIN